MGTRTFVIHWPAPISRTIHIDEFVPNANQEDALLDDSTIYDLIGLINTEFSLGAPDYVFVTDPRREITA